MICIFTEFLFFLKSIERKKVRERVGILNLTFEKKIELKSSVI